MDNALNGPAIPTQVCEICGAEGAAISMVDHEFDYRAGDRLVTLNVRVPVVECASCDDGYFAEGAEAIKHEAVCNYLGRLTPKEILGLREQLGMSQAQFARHTGIGVASIKRWETGIVIQGQAFDNQLRALIEDLVVKNAQSWTSVFRTEISEATRQRARSFSLRPSHCRQLEAA
ncbi:type II TA system antitoxin MqsA family protein [Ruegeria sp. HKCCA5763]|uniref:type II TA system antitoxin MqsA family protein n=1 Tax=Ruegeria sp. HKCCA5763 TaxID=2682987 RepID=UPI001488A417|nr:type II TA system antitoxin MqsA family protein [Ruegeria sp. HKCCA5763]